MSLTVCACRVRLYSLFASVARMLSSSSIASGKRPDRPVLFATAERKRPVVPAAAASKVEPRKPAGVQGCIPRPALSSWPDGVPLGARFRCRPRRPDDDRPRCCSVGRRGSAGRDLQDRLRPAGGARHHGPCTREHAGVLVAARPDLRPTDELPGQGGVTGIQPGARGRRGAAEDVAGRKDVHVHAQAWLPVQRWKAGRCTGVRARDQPHADTGAQVAGDPVHAGHRGRPRRTGGYRRRVPAEWSRRDTASSSASSDRSATSPRARACRSSAPSRRISRRSGGSRWVPGIRPVLRLGVPAR